MSLLHFTQPLIHSKNVSNKVSTVTLGEHILSVVRIGSEVYAFPERCPHRGTPLQFAQTNSTAQEMLCPYHGWRIDCTGNVRKPFSDQVECKVPVQKLQLAFDYYWWVHDSQPIPIQQAPEFQFCGAIEFKLSAPYHVVLDNFNEGSHTPWVHSLTGPSPQDFTKVKFNWSNETDHVKICYEGAQKLNFVFWFLAPLGGMRWFIEWKTFFNPTYSFYASKWYDEKTNRTYLLNHTYYYMVPCGPQHTKLHAFVLSTTPSVLKFFPALARFLTRLLTWNQIKEDERFYPKIAALPKSFKGMHLDEFDRPMIAIRQRAQKEYIKQEE